MRQRIAVLASFSGTSGVERMVTNLVTGFERQGLDVELLLIRLTKKAEREYLKDISTKNIRITRLKGGHNLTIIPELVYFLRNNAPEAMLVVKDRAIFAASIASLIAGSSTRIIGRLGTTVSEAIHGKPIINRLTRKAMMRFSYRVIDSAICVSKGVAHDLCLITGIPVSRFHIIPNPVITPELFELASMPCQHPWLKEKVRPVILGIGRLTEQKDFKTLILAFYELKRLWSSSGPLPCLIILGEGSMRKELEALVASLGIEADISMPGFQSNPYCYLKNSDLFVLSSKWEGSPNVLTEALSLGVPVVATDCKSGPKDILKNGKVAPLVPVEDPKTMARTMKHVMMSPPPKSALKEAVKDYEQIESVKRYIKVLLNNE